MLYVIYSTLITFSVIYTAVGFIKSLIKFFRCKDEYADDGTFVVLRVCNQEENVEAVVRMLICKYLKISNGEFIPNILIIDMGSTDTTPDICRRLCTDYSFVYYTTYEDYAKMTDMF